MKQTSSTEKLAAIELEKRRMTNGKVYSRFDTATDVVGNVKEAVSAGIWSDGSGTLSTFFINSTQSGSTARYFLDVSNLDTWNFWFSSTIFSCIWKQSR